MSISKILTPDESEFFDYLKEKHIYQFKDFIDIEKYNIDFIGMYSDNRTFLMGFSQLNNYPHEISEHFISFKVSHNHGNFLVHDIHINEIEPISLFEDGFFYIENRNSYELEIY